MVADIPICQFRPDRLHSILVSAGKTGMADCFEGIDIERDRFGMVVSAYAFCIRCDRSRSLRVNEYSGAYGLTCPACESRQTLSLEGDSAPD